MSNTIPVLGQDEMIHQRQGNGNDGWLWKNNGLKEGNPALQVKIQEIYVRLPGSDNKPYCVHVVDPVLSGKAKIDQIPLEHRFNCWSHALGTVDISDGTGFIPDRDSLPAILGNANLAQTIRTQATIKTVLKTGPGLVPVKGGDVMLFWLDGKVEHACVFEDVRSTGASDGDKITYDTMMETKNGPEKMKSQSLEQLMTVEYSRDNRGAIIALGDRIVSIHRMVTKVFEKKKY